MQPLLMAAAAVVKVAGGTWPGCTIHSTSFHLKLTVTFSPLGMKFADKHARRVSLNVAGGGVKAAASSISGLISFMPSALCVCVFGLDGAAVRSPGEVCDLQHPPGAPQSASSSPRVNTLTNIQGKLGCFSPSSSPSRLIRSGVAPPPPTRSSSS